MKDYKHYTGEICTCAGIAYPDFAIGTYLRTKYELINLLNEYPYDKLMIDTAYRYGNEQDVAHAIRKSAYPLDRIIYIGKISTIQQESEKTAREEFTGTLNRLQIPKINIYLIHSSRSPKYCSTWAELIKLKDEGLIDTIGVSNFDINAIERLYNSTGLYPEVNQIVPSQLKFSDGNLDLLRFCREKHIHVQVAMPFGGDIIGRELSQAQRQEILIRLRQQGLTCVFGTTNINHLCQNISWLELGR